MTRPIIVQPEAEADISEAFRWYEAREDGLGRQLIDEIDRAFAQIAAAPLRSPVVHGPARRARLRRFPYGVLYVTRDDEIVILAVLHDRRHPGLAKSRTPE